MAPHTFPEPRPELECKENTVVRILEPGRILGKEFAVLCATLAAACALVFNDFLNNQKIYLFKDIGSDSVNIYFPWLVHLSDYLRENGLPGWTFSQGLGQNFFPFCFGDIFSLILAFFISKPYLPYGIVWMECIKIILCGIMFFCYLQEMKINRSVSVLCAFLYSFCGYVIVGGCWTIFSAEALYAAVILYGFERWLNRGEWLWFVAGLTCMSILQPFFLFLYALFFMTYIPVRYIEVRQDSWGNFSVFVLKTAGYAALGVAVGAYQVLPDVLQYLESPRVGGEAGLAAGLLGRPVFALSDGWLMFSTVFRSFGSDILGTGSKYTGWMNYLESPLFYCGIICLVAFPQIIQSLINIKLKTAYALFLAVWTIPLIFPFFRYFFWAFSGNYFRTLSLVIVIILLLCTARSLDYIASTGTLNRKVLAVTVVSLLFLLYAPPRQFTDGINPSIQMWVGLLICTYAALLLTLTVNRSRRAVSIVIMLFCFVEMVVFSHRTVNDRNVITSRELDQKTGYNDYTVDAVKLIKENDKGFYRINKSYSSGPAIHKSINDAKVQGYFGTSSYSSFNQISYVRFLAALNVIYDKNEIETRWITGLENRQILFSLVSGRYLLGRQSQNDFQGIGYAEIAKVGDVHIYQNQYALPLGFTYDHVLDEQTFLKLQGLLKDLSLLKGCVIASDDKAMADFPRIVPVYIPPEHILVHVNTDLNARRSEKLILTTFTENRILGNITVPRPRVLFLSVPYDKGWHAKVNGTETPVHRVNVGFCGLVIPSGSSSVEFYFIPRLMRLGAVISLLAIVLVIVLQRSDRRKIKARMCSATVAGI